MQRKQSYRPCRICGYAPTRGDEPNIISNYYDEDDRSYVGEGWTIGPVCNDCRAEQAQSSKILDARKIIYGEPRAFPQ